MRAIKSNAIALITKALFGLANWAIYIGLATFLSTAIAAF
jgi:hypothetical protein